VKSFAGELNTCLLSGALSDRDKLISQDNSQFEFFIYHTFLKKQQPLRPLRAMNQLQEV
jgi:hypothetical protein